MGLGTKHYRFKEFKELYKLYPAGIFTDLDALKRFMSFIKNNTADTLKNEINEIENEIEKENDIIEIIEKKFEDEVESIENLAFDSNVDYIDYYSSKGALNLVYNSILITLCSFLETRVKLLCTLLGYRKGSFRKKRNTESFLSFYMSYLNGEHHIDFSAIDDYWKKIEQYSTLRNTITHNEKQVIGVPSEKFRKIKQISYLNIIKKGKNASFIIDDPRLLEECFDTVKGILEFICYKEVKTPNL